MDTAANDRVCDYRKHAEYRIINPAHEYFNHVGRLIFMKNATAWLCLPDGILHVRVKVTDICKVG